MNLSKNTKKISILLISLFCFLFSSFMPFATAKAVEPTESATNTAASSSSDSPNTWYNQNPFQWYSKVYDKDNPSEIFGERYTAAQVQWILFSLITVPISTLETFNVSGAEGACLLGSLGGAATELPLCIDSYIQTITDLMKSIGITSIDRSNESAIASIFNAKDREISAINYFSKSFKKFSIVKEAKAQTGFGFSALGVVQPLWTAARNASYGIIVLITIIFSFMIMFRVKLSPQLVISVQSALPKVFTVLVLATFSFAIAGLMVDLMYVFMGFIAAILSSISGGIMSFGFVYSFISGNWFGVHVSSSFAVGFYMFLYTILFLITIIATFVGALTSLSSFGVVMSILALLVVAWLIILCFWYMIKIPWMLIKSLASIYMSVIIAPLQITIGAIAPQVGFSQWLRGIIANLLVFPVTGIFFWLAYLLLFQGFMTAGEVMIERNVLSELVRMFGFELTGIFTGQLWSPPMLGSGAEITGLIFAMMSFMVIVAIPKTVDIMKMLVMGAKFDFGTAMGEAISLFKIGATGYGAYAASELKQDGRPWPFGFFKEGGKVDTFLTKNNKNISNTLETLLKFIK